MKRLQAGYHDSHRSLAALVGLLLIGLLALPGRVQGIEDPPGCSVANGGNGISHEAGLNFSLTQAHVGDSVQVFPFLGMAANACRAINATGSIYIATGLLTNFLVNATLDPGMLVSCPASGICEPGPYNILITPALIGAPVNTPLRNVPGLPNMVRAAGVAFFTVLSGDNGEPLDDFLHYASIRIVRPDIQVFSACNLPGGQDCFAEGVPICFTGYVTNCGDICLINVTVRDGRTGQLLDTNGLPLIQPLTLLPGQAVGFQGTFEPTLEETSGGIAATIVTVRGTDITTIGGPRASVTNQATLFGAICRTQPVLAAPACTANNQFQFTVAGRAGSNYVIQVSTNLDGANWFPLCTNTAPFTFADSNAALYPARFYRAVVLP